MTDSASSHDSMGVASAIPAGRVLIFDTTLRDGEQSPGASMTHEDKCEIAALLDEMGVDVIEAGFPIASEGDFEAVKAIAGLVKRASVCGLARASKKDILRAWEALEGARNPRIHTFLSTSPLHMKHKLNLEPEQVLAKIHESVSYARSLCDNVQWSPEDGTRTEREFLAKAVRTALEAGANTINIPDTVGYTIPNESAQIIRQLREDVPEIDEKAIIATHCHNDLGMAVANSLAAVSAGARQIECTINGLGERAGNAALEEAVMALRVRRDVLPYESGVDPVYLARASRMVANATGFPVQYNKAIVGKNAFAHESGIHQDGMLKHAGTYEIMTPETVGVSKTNLVLGKHSGRHALKERLKELGYDLGDNALQDAFVRFKALGDAKREIFDEDLIALVDDAASEVEGGEGRVKLIDLQVESRMGQRAKSRVVLEIDGQRQEAEGEGDGPVDAAYKAVKALVKHQGKLQLFQVTSVTGGTDAQAEVSVRLEEGGYIAASQAADTDTVVAAAKAYVNALNKLFLRRQKTAPESSALAG
ncbi:2-isopropylmalate synthase [Neomegalonema perideroedes]|uniref:2-isopropylmalate synthase n=1 Tax=Neomegalonema perideroedes TaxID=217219 RepID=UPI000380F21D|nr:2-isopropylmalate synthase [Neomegalonema perideroedes]